MPPSNSAFSLGKSNIYNRAERLCRKSTCGVRGMVGINSQKKCTILHNTRLFVTLLPLKGPPSCRGRRATIKNSAGERHWQGTKCCVPPPGLRTGVSSRVVHSRGEACPRPIYALSPCSLVLALSSPHPLASTGRELPPRECRASQKSCLTALALCCILSMTNRTAVNVLIRISRRWRSRAASRGSASRQMDTASNPPESVSE